MIRCKPSIDAPLIFVRLASITPSDTRVTAQGFQFLLQGTNAQLWVLLQQYINGVADGDGVRPARVCRIRAWQSPPLM